MKKVLSVLFVLMFFALTIFAQSAKNEKAGIEQYLNIRAASAPSFSPDGKQIAFLTNTTGTNQIWIVPTNGSEPPKQLTDYEDNISFVKFSPTDNLILFGKAAGGDENAQLFLMKSDGSNIRQLTDDASVRNNFGRWTDDGTRIFYASNKRDRNYFDVYAMNVATGKDELILEQNGSNSVAAVSKDGKKIIVSQAGTEFGLDNDLYLVETETKKVELLTKHQGAAQFTDVNFANNNKFIYLTSNSNCEYFTQTILDLTNPKSSSHCNEKFDLDSVEYSLDKKKIALVANTEGASRLTLVNILTSSIPLFTKSSANLKADEVKLPSKGIVGALDFAQNGKHLALTFSSAKYNPDIWLYDLGTKKLSQ